MQFNIQIFLIGCLGGLLPELIRTAKNINKVLENNYLTEGLYYISLFSLILLGGLAAWLLGAQNALSALAFGYAAPEIFSTVLAKRETTAIASRDEPKKKRSKFNIRHWWSY